jgi:anti-anti-sigma factor
MALAIDVQTRDHGQHVALKGRLDTDTSPELEKVVSPWIDNPNVYYVAFDLADLEYISSAGLRVFFRLRNSLESHDGTLLVSNLQPQVQKVFDIVKAMPKVSVFTSIAELDDYLDAIQKKVTGETEE